MLMSSLSNFSFVFGRAICRKRLLPFADLACICPFSMWWAVLQQHQSQSSLQTPPFGHQNPSCHSFSHSQSLMLEYSLTFSCKIRVQDNIKVIIVPSLSLILAPSVRNWLPFHIQNATTIDSFQSALKTHLFNLQEFDQLTSVWCVLCVCVCVCTCACVGVCVLPLWVTTTV